MRKNKSKITWNVLITLIISLTGIVLSIQANNISKLQAEIARNSTLPVIMIDEKVTAENSLNGEERSIIEIYNLDGKMNNYQSSIITFLSCEFSDSELGAFNSCSVPIVGYYLFNTDYNNVYGKIDHKDSIDNYALLHDLQKDILQYNRENDKKQTILASLQSYLEISYLNLLGEESKLYYQIEPHKITLVDTEFGKTQFEKYRYLVKEGYGMNPNNTGAISVDNLIKNITNILSLDTIQFYDDGTKSKDEKANSSDNDLFDNLICTIVGAILAMLGGTFVPAYEQKKKEKHAAAILYYDLKSIGKYLTNEVCSANLRYSQNWQEMVGACSFLEDKYVDLLYDIYDEVYNYNCSYKENEDRDSLKEYQNLKRMMIDKSDDDSKKNYDQLIEKLEKVLKENWIIMVLREIKNFFHTF